MDSSQSGCQIADFVEICQSTKLLLTKKDEVTRQLNIYWPKGSRFIVSDRYLKLWI